MRHFILLNFAALTLFSGTQVYAQSQFPEFMLTPDFQVKEPVIQESERVEINLRNPLMRDVISLQEQITLLESLVERQSEIQRIAENYQDLGLPYKQPPPPRNACQKLPTNVLCLFFYPDMNNNRALLDEAKNRIIDRQQQAMIDTLAQFQLSESDLEQPLDTPAMSMPQQTRYAWADIQCLRSECSALIVSDNGQVNRYRVKSGEIINNDITIQSVTPVGVTAMINKEKKELPPLAMNEDDRAITDPIPISTILEANRPDAQLPPSIPEDVPFAGETESTETGMLGPTGLF